jgi:hypothetical protein
LPLDGVAAHRCAWGSVDVDAEENVDQPVVFNQRARRGGDDARVLAVERVAGVLHDEAAHGRVGRFEATRCLRRRWSSVAPSSPIQVSGRSTTGCR